MQGALLRILSKYGGELHPDNPEAKDSFKKAVAALAKNFTLYFPIDYDPFYPYEDCPEKRGKFYKFKPLLIPSEDVRQANGANKEKTREEEIAELFKQQTEDMYSGEE